jgi:hypothetical protein
VRNGDDVFRGELLGFVQLFATFNSVEMRATWVLHDIHVSDEGRRLEAGEALLEFASMFAKRDLWPESDAETQALLQQLEHATRAREVGQRHSRKTRPLTSRNCVCVSQVAEREQKSLEFRLHALQKDASPSQQALERIDAGIQSHLWALKEAAHSLRGMLEAEQQEQQNRVRALEQSANILQNQMLALQGNAVRLQGEVASLREQLRAAESRDAETQRRMNEQLTKAMKELRDTELQFEEKERELKLEQARLEQARAFLESHNEALSKALATSVSQLDQLESEYQTLKLSALENAGKPRPTLLNGVSIGVNTDMTWPVQEQSIHRWTQSASAKIQAFRKGRPSSLQNVDAARRRSVDRSFSSSSLGENGGSGDSDIVPDQPPHQLPPPPQQQPQPQQQQQQQ